MYTNERVLQCFLRILAIAQHVLGESQATRIAQLHQRRKRLAFATCCTFDDVRSHC